MGNQTVHIANPPTATSKTHQVFDNVIVDVKTSQHTRIHKIRVFANFAAVQQNCFCLVIMRFGFI